MKVVLSKTGKTKCGLPMGGVLCRTEEEVNHVVQLAEDPIVEDYITLDNEEYFEKVRLENGFGYRNKKYDGPVAQQATLKEVNNDTHN